MNRYIPGAVAVAGIFFVVIALISIPSSAEATTYIGMYADQEHSRCDSYPPLYMLMHYWSWVRPGEDGMLCVEYEITTPANVIEAATIVNPAAGYHIGDAIVPPGATVCFPTCVTDWIWIHQLTCLVTVATPSQISIVPHEDYEVLHAINCIEVGDSIETMTKLQDLYLFQDCWFSTTESSWGAIKSLLK